MTINFHLKFHIFSKMFPFIAFSFFLLYIVYYLFSIKLYFTVRKSSLIFCFCKDVKNLKLPWLNWKKVLFFSSPDRFCPKKLMLSLCCVCISTCYIHIHMSFRTKFWPYNHYTAPHLDMPSTPYICSITTKFFKSSNFISVFSFSLNNF